MKKSLLVVVYTLLVLPNVFPQDDKRLMERLDSVLHYTQQSRFNELLNFTYPKLFSIAPRDKMLESLKAAIDNEDFSASIDSVKLYKIHPLFTEGSGNYVKIRHSMVMYMKFKETIDTSDKEALDFMVSMMEEDLGKGNVSFHKASNTFRVFMLADLVAIRDEHSPEWTFVNFDDDDESLIAPLLFPEEVLKKLRSLQ